MGATRRSNNKTYKVGIQWVIRTMLETLPEWFTFLGYTWHTVSVMVAFFIGVLLG